MELNESLWRAPAKVDVSSTEFLNSTKYLTWFTILYNLVSAVSTIALFLKL